MAWSEHRLDELFDIARGGSPRPIKQYLTNEESGVNWIKISDATSSEKYIYKTKEKIKPEGVNRSRLVHEGDFILSNSMSFGRPYIMKTSGCIHDGWVVLSPKSERVDQDFLFHLLGSPVVYQQFDQLAAGSTVRNLNIGLVSSVRVPVPPLTEQKQIVAILDEAFANIDHARQLAERNLKNARELFDSTLNKIFVEGQSKWKSKTFDDVCLKIQDGAHHSPQKLYPNKSTNLFPYITSKNIRNNYMDLSKVQYVDSEFHGSIYPRCNPEFGDVLLTKDGANTGNVTLNTLDEPFSLLSSVCLIKPDREKLNPSFCKYFIQSRMGFEHITGQMTGMAIKRIILKSIKSSFIPLPELSKQESIVKKLDIVLIEVAELEKIYQQKITALDELKQSLLQKAFRGELTQEKAAA